MCFIKKEALTKLLKRQSIGHSEVPVNNIKTHKQILHD